MRARSSRKRLRLGQQGGARASQKGERGLASGAAAVGVATARAIAMPAAGSSAPSCSSRTVSRPTRVCKCCQAAFPEEPCVVHADRVKQFCCPEAHVCQQPGLITMSAMITVHLRVRARARMYCAPPLVDLALAVSEFAGARRVQMGAPRTQNPFFAFSIDP